MGFKCLIRELTACCTSESVTKFVPTCSCQEVQSYGNYWASTANYKSNYKTQHTKAGVCFSYQSLHKVTTQKNRTVNPLKPNDQYSGRTAPLTFKRCILYIYSTNIGTEYLKHGIYSLFFQNAVCFIILTYLVPVLFTFYIQSVLKLKTFYIFIQQIQVLNILNMVYTLRFFSLQNAVCFIILTYLVPVLFTFYIQDVLKLKK